MHDAENAPPPDPAPRDPARRDDGPGTRPRTSSQWWWVVVAALVVPVLGPLWIGQHGMGWAYAAVAAWAATIGVAVWHMRRQHRRFDAAVAAWAGERARAAERLHIAADLHDLVSHGLGVITMRAAAARVALGDAGDPAAAALADIEGVSRQTTVELRRMLGLLSTPGAAPLRPAETFTDLPAVIESVGGGGLTVTTAITARDASPGVQQAACAVVREALHNTLRHAGPATARVSVDRDPQGVVGIVVSDDGPRAPHFASPGTGRGLAGLRERVTALGGTFRAGPTARGFEVEARIPDGAP